MADGVPGARLRDQTGIEQLVALQSAVSHHVSQLQTLWRVANNPLLRGNDLIDAMLREAAATLRPDQRFAGLLGRLDGDMLVVCSMSGDVGIGPAGKPLQLGDRLPIGNTISFGVAAETRTMLWDDVTEFAELPERVRTNGWRSVAVTQFSAGLGTYSLLFVSRALPASPFTEQTRAFIEVLGAFFANQLQVTGLVASLQRAEELARQHAERLESLWRIVNNPRLKETALWHAMLGQAAGSIRPGQPYRGMLGRVRDTDLVVEAIAAADGQELGSQTIEAMVGQAIPLASLLVGGMIRDGGTHSWDDIQTTDMPAPFARARGVHSFIGTTFAAGGTTWSLTFSSEEPSEPPLGQQDRAYVELLASFFANNLQQRWQFDRIQYQQAHDVLTGLYNRSQFRSRSRAASLECRTFAVILVDVDAFREVNESYGHMVGDSLLVEVGNALRRRARTADIVGRIGGNVFGIFIPDPGLGHQVKRRALEFAEAFATGFSTGDSAGTSFVSLSGCLGIALAPPDGADVDAILLHADAALFAAKERGTGTTVFYEAGMEGNAQRRSVLRSELNAAVGEEQFTLYYQPHLDIVTGAVTGAEALIRWRHPRRGLLSPAEFIPFAEETGIIRSIDAWVTQAALRAAKLLADVRPGFRLFFNLSGRQAGDLRIIRTLSEASRAGLSLDNVGVEITETDAMRDVEATRRVCLALHGLGVRIAIDDFGTGYSSLSSLKRLPVDILKIDQSFISGILTDPQDETITETIISIAQRFGFEPLAEGVERHGEVVWLKAHGCRLVQGFLFSRPMPFEGFLPWLMAHAGGPAAVESAR